jgi:hypothetical protein
VYNSTCTNDGTGEPNALPNAIVMHPGTVHIIIGTAGAGLESMDWQHAV